MAIGDSIDIVRVKQFESNVLHLSQQKVSRLRPFVMAKRIKGKSTFLDRIGTTEMHERQARNEDVREDDVLWSRRRLTMRPYAWSHYTDNFDLIQNIHDPSSETSKAAMYAAGRRIDKIILGGIGGTSYAGEEGETSVALPAAQKIACPASDTSATHSSLSIEGLIRIRKRLWETEAIEDEGMQLPFVTNSAGLESLLRDTKVQSHDYNTVKALVAGAVDTFMGFKFIRLEFLPSTTAAITTGPTGSTTTAPVGSTRNFAFVPESICLGIGQDVTADAGTVLHKYNSHLAILQMAMGSTRLEEVKVVELITAA